MKKLLLLIFAASLLSPTASAAPKAVAVKKLDIVASAVNAEGLVATGKTLVIYSNTGSTNSNIELTGLDVAGVQQWVRTIDSGVDEIATAATVDAAGNDSDKALCAGPAPSDRSCGWFWAQARTAPASATATACRGAIPYACPDPHPRGHRPADGPLHGAPPRPETPAGWPDRGQG